jgi:hypothetical protein
MSAINLKKSRMQKLLKRFNFGIFSLRFGLVTTSNSYTYIGASLEAPPMGLFCYYLDSMNLPSEQVTDVVYGCLSVVPSFRHLIPFCSTSRVWSWVLEGVQAQSGSGVVLGVVPRVVATPSKDTTKMKLRVWHDVSQLQPHPVHPNDGQGRVRGILNSTRSNLLLD